MFVVKRTLSLGAGSTVGAYMVLRMDDMVYNQLRRHVIVPFQVLRNSEKISKDDLRDVGVGTKNFLMQFKPMATTRVSAKKLLMDDGDYSTAQDHYFSFINNRSGAVVDKSLDNKIIDDLKMDNYMPDLTKNRVFQIEEEMQYDAHKLLVDESLKPKHSRKDYDNLAKLRAGDVIMAATVESKKVKYHDDAKSQYSDMLKIEQKKKQLSKKKAAQKKRDQELREALSVPGAIQSEEQALELYEKQNLKASAPSERDIKRLERLKRKATEEPRASAVKISLPASDVHSIEAQYEQMEEERLFDNTALTGIQMQALKAEQGNLEKEAIRRLNKPTLEDMMHRPNQEAYTKKRDGKQLNQ